MGEERQTARACRRARRRRARVEADEERCRGPERDGEGQQELRGGGGGERRGSKGERERGRERGDRNAAGRGVGGREC